MKYLILLFIFSSCGYSQYPRLKLYKGNVVYYRINCDSVKNKR